MTEALHYLHTQKRLLHGDVKSANVLVLGDFERVKLCDFGVAIALNEDMRAAVGEEYVGTGPWCAMEVYDENGVITHKTDIFALGCLIYEMLALEAPHISKLQGDDDSFTEDDEVNSAVVLSLLVVLTRKYLRLTVNEKT